MSRSGAVEVTDEGSFIPATQRPDGTWRKPRRVKDGYVPQDEVPLYESKGKQWANNQSRQYPVGLDPAIIKAREEAKTATVRSPIPGLVIDNEGKQKKKKKVVQNGMKEQLEVTKTETVSSKSQAADEWTTVSSKSVKLPKAESVAKKVVTTVADPAKKLKNLKKKLREIEAVEAKIESGEIKKPDKDQMEKVNRKSDVLSEVLALELNLV